MPSIRLIIIVVVVEGWAMLTQFARRWVRSWSRRVRGLASLINVFFISLDVRNACSLIRYAF